MKKLVLLASLLGSVACHMPPETEPRPQVRVIYIYETPRYGYGYGYNSRYDDCWMGGSSNDFYCSGFRYLPRVYIPMSPQRDGRIDLPRQPEPPRRAVPRGVPGVPPGQHPYGPPKAGPPRVNPPNKPELPHRMIPREQPQSPIDESRRAEPSQQPPQQMPRGTSPPIIPPPRRP